MFACDIFSKFKVKVKIADSIPRVKYAVITKVGRTSLKVGVLKVPIQWSVLLLDFVVVLLRHSGAPGLSGSLFI